MSDKKNNDNFDWDEYDFLTADQSSIDKPISRRNRSSAQKSNKNATRKTTAVPANENNKEKKQSVSTQSGKRRKKKKRLTEKQITFRKRATAVFVSIVLIAFVILGSIFVGMYAAVSREIKDMNIKGLALNSTSFIYYDDASGTPQQLEQIQSDSSRIWIDSSEIPQIMKDAMVSIEDERFYKHNGVDIKRTFGATVKYALSKFGLGRSDYGGSTITQQVIKNITNEKEKTSIRKIKEMMRAIALEQQLSKDEILTLYLNIVYFANNCYGIEAASNAYFAKPAMELTLAEAASIAGITQYPAEYDPYVHPENNIKKRNTVLQKMYELGYISESEYLEASSSDLVVNNAYRENGARISSYFVDQVVNDVISDLQTKKGYSQDFAKQQVYNGGLKIYSTVDINIQQILEDVYYNITGFPRTGKGGQSAMVIMDPYSGQIKGLIGGLGEKTDIRGFNRATQAQRQPGSSIKPLSVYGPAVDLGKVSSVTTVIDEEITIGNDKWKPKNAYNDFYGPMTVKEAVARSSNIPAVKVLDMVGLSTSYGYMQNKFHLSSMVEDDKNYSSLALGGLTKGVSPKEMAAAYSVFVNSGRYIEPHTYTRVEDASGQIILENTSESTQSISAAAAYITSDLLYAVVNSGVGTASSAALDSGIPTYGKTGTTDDDCDKWFVGFTPYYVGAIWYGFDSPSSLSAAGVRGNPCVTVWKTVMERVHSGMPEKILTRPTNVVESTVCLSSGMLASRSCNAVTSYFVDGTQPKSTCDKSHASKYTPTQPPISYSDIPTPTRVPSATTAPAASSAPVSGGTNGTNNTNGTPGTAPSVPGDNAGTNAEVPGNVTIPNTGANVQNPDVNSGSSTGNNTPANGDTTIIYPDNVGGSATSGGNEVVDIPVPQGITDTE